MSTSNEVDDLKAAISVITKDAVEPQEQEAWKAFLLGDEVCPPPSFIDPWRRGFWCWQTADQWLAQCKAEGLHVLNDWECPHGVLRETEQRLGRSVVVDALNMATLRLRRGLVLLDLGASDEGDYAYFARRHAEAQAMALRAEMGVESVANGKRGRL